MPQVTFNELVEGVCSGHQLASFPTDTVPALAAHPERADLIFVAKQRSLDKPLILMAGQEDDLWDYVTGSAEAQRLWQAVAAQYWPGALTLVLPASSKVPPALNPNHPGTIGIRVPNHAIAQTILRHTGPLATTSANRSGEPALQTMPEIAETFPQVLMLSPEEPLMRANPALHGSLGSGVPSTVIQWTEKGWVILRQGAVVLSA